MRTQKCREKASTLVEGSTCRKNTCRPKSVALEDTQLETEHFNDPEISSIGASRCQASTLTPSNCECSVFFIFTCEEFVCVCVCVCFCLCVCVCVCVFLFV